MESGVVAAGAAAIAYYVYLKTKREMPNGISSSGETHRHVEQAPSNWTGELYLFAEALRYLYLEYITHWPTADLFIGLTYLARQGIKDFPAAEVVAHGTRLNPRALNQPQASELRVLHTVIHTSSFKHAFVVKDKLNVMYRLLVYSQKLRNMSHQIPESEWQDLQIGSQDFVAYHSKASVLRPAYIIVRDPILNAFVLAVRGTHTTRDIFTSLSGAAKPHHTVINNNVVLGYSHFGMLAGARWIFKHCQKTLFEAHKADPEFKLIVTGHSMGGGAATMLTMMIREQLSIFKDTECFTFACPGCMTLELAQSCSSYVTTLVYGTDVVPTVSPGAGDLLREEVAQSSWAKSFKQDIRSSAIVQSIEGRVRGMYRSASAWTLRQAKTVSSLTTRCVRPRETSELETPLQPRQDEVSSVADPCLPPKQMTTSFSGENENQNPVVLQEKETPKQSPTSAKLNGYLTDAWGKLTSFSWKRKVTDTEATLDSVERSEDSDGVVEGVFNTKGLENAVLDDNGNENSDGVVMEEEEANSSNDNNQNCKRLLYPAGTIYHLVPAYILKSNRPVETELSNLESEPTTSNSATRGEEWYGSDPTLQEIEEDEFVLFSDMPQEAYGRIRVCRSMVMDHYVPRYKTAVQATIQALNVVLEKETIQDI